MASQNAEEAVMGGLRVRKVTAGMEILWMAPGDPRTSGGSALAAEGFEVGDIITAVDGMDAVRFRADEVLANIAFQRGGVGEVRIDGYRRIAAFPRPSRTPISGIVPRQAFRPVGEEAVYESTSLRNTDALINDNIIDADNEVSRLLLEVEDRADEIRRSRGLSSTPAPPLSAVKAPFSPSGYNSQRPLSSPSHHLSPPSSNNAALPRSPPSSLFAAGRRGDLPLPPGGIDASLNSTMYTTGGGGGGGGGGRGSVQAASYSAAMLRQIRAGERFLRSDDADLAPYLEPDPEGMGRDTEEAWGGMKSLLAETALLKGGYLKSQHELKDLRDKLARMNWALDGMGKMNIELQKRAGKVAAYKWMALCGSMNMDLEEDKRREWAVEMAEAKRDWKTHHNATHVELTRVKSAAGEGASAEMREMAEAMEAEAQSLRDQLEATRQEHATALRILKNQQQAELLRLQNAHTKDLAEKDRDYQVAKIQLTHQRDVFHSKLLEKNNSELNEREVVAGLSSVNADQQSTIADLQGIVEGMRELEKNNAALIEEQKAEIMGLQARLRTSTEQLVETEAREFAVKEHFTAVGKENHATILSLAQDLQFLIKRREEDIAAMAEVHAAEKATFQRHNDSLLQQLTSLRQDVAGQVLRMARRLAGARILVSSLKATGGTHAWETQGGRYPGVHVGDQKIKIHGTGDGKTADVSKEDLEELKTDLEEQNGIATALQTLIQEDKKLQEDLQAERALAQAKGKEALEYKMKYHGEFAKTEAVRASKAADVLRQELATIDNGPWPPNSAKSLPTPARYLANSTPASMTHGALFSPNSFSPPNSLPQTLPPQSVQPAF